MPSVSIIIPTYNRANLVKASIESVLSQTFEDFEVIIVDDGSSDHTTDVFQNLKDSRIKIIRLHFSNGVAHARNVGIQRSTAKYIAFQDSDDFWHKEKLEKQMKVLESADSFTGAVYTGFWLNVEGNRTYIPSKMVSKKEGDIYVQLLQNNFITSQTILIRKQCLIGCGVFDESLPVLEDWDLWLRIARDYSFKIIDEPLVNIYRTPDGLSTNLIYKDIAIQTFLKKHADEYKKYPEIWAEYLRSYGSFKIVDRGSVQAGRSYLLKSFAIQRNIKTIMGLIASMAGGNGYRFARRIWRLLNTSRNRFMPKC